MDPHSPSAGLGEAIRPVGVGRTTSKRSFCWEPGTAGLCPVGSGRKPCAGGGVRGDPLGEDRVGAKGFKAAPRPGSAEGSVLQRASSHARTGGTAQGPTIPTTMVLSKAPVPRHLRGVPRDTGSPGIKCSSKLACSALKAGRVSFLRPSPA